MIFAVDLDDFIVDWNLNQVQELEAAHAGFFQQLAKRGVVCRSVGRKSLSYILSFVYFCKGD